MTAATLSRPCLACNARPACRSRSKAGLCYTCDLEGRTRPACHHCGGPFTPGRWQKRLCWTCRQKPELRALYRSASVYVRQGVGLANSEPPPPASPTGARPGSEEKVRVMEERAALGVGIWHRDDYRGGDE